MRKYLRNMQTIKTDIFDLVDKVSMKKWPKKMGEQNA